MKKLKFGNSEPEDVRLQAKMRQQNFLAAALGKGNVVPWPRSTNVELQTPEDSARAKAAWQIDEIQRALSHMDPKDPHYMWQNRGVNPLTPKQPPAQPKGFVNRARKTNKVGY